MSQPKKKRKMMMVHPPSPIKQEFDLPGRVSHDTPDHPLVDSPPRDLDQDATAKYQVDENKYDVAMAALGFDCDPQLSTDALFNIGDSAISKNKKTSYLVQARGYDSNKQGITYALVAQDNGQVAFVDEDDLLKPEKRDWIVKDADGKDVIQLEFIRIGCQGGSGVHAYTYTGLVKATTGEEFRLTNKLTLALK